MTMNYHLKTNNRKKSRKFFWFVLVVLIIFAYPKIANLFSGVFKSALTPFWNSENKLEEKSLNLFGFFSTKEKLLSANEQLKKDLLEAEMMLADRNLLLKENLELKEFMGRLITDDMILASVLAKPNASLYDTAIIDVGNNLGIKVGDKIFVQGNILIGEIAEVSKNISKVKFYSSFKEQVSVMVGLYNIEATAVGRGAGNFEIKLPRDIDIKVDDPVFIAGTEARVLGNVAEIIFDPKDPFQLVLIKSPVNLFELKWVQILKSE
ncbi:MAG: rod shape-determining protein MreC [Candidatus Pacebacteria bacterium]|nr:rod shape-determining protein MreC [Candidatus Paceibacterota bacterium]